MMTTEIKENEEVDNLPDLIKHNDDTDSDNDSNKEAKIETKQLAQKKTGSHPEMIIALPIAPGSKKNKTMQCLLDMCATGSLMDPKFFR
eukprot:7694072-Ditylum_brightwellii.AAC.1